MVGASRGAVGESSPQPARSARSPANEMTTREDHAGRPRRDATNGERTAERIGGWREELARLRPADRSCDSAQPRITFGGDVSRRAKAKTAPSLVTAITKKGSGRPRS